MSIALDEQRFSRIENDREPDFIELGTLQPATARRAPYRSPARQNPDRSADAAQDSAAAPVSIRVDPQHDTSRRRYSERRWIQLLERLFTFERNTGYAISITVHAFLIIILSLFLLRGSAPAPKIVLNSTFSEELPSVSASGALDAELTLPDAPVENVPIVGDVESAGGAGLGRLFGFDGAEFFGLRAGGNDFVYIVDCSGSMKGAPFARARREMLDSIDELRPDQRMYVMFYANTPYLMFNESGPPATLIPATDENKERLRKWVARINADGGTQPEQPLKWALGLGPDAIFLLTDGQFGDIVNDITSANGGRSRIHTISFMNRSGEELLRRIADENAGTYRFVP
jgi:von Willebrand factor type A domain